MAPREMLAQRETRDPLALPQLERPDFRVPQDRWARPERLERVFRDHRELKEFQDIPDRQEFQDNADLPVSQVSRECRARRVPRAFLESARNRDD